MTEIRITDPKTGGQKGQKPERFDLLPFDALEEIARVYGFGAGKYEDHNWLKGYKWSLSSGALLRHVARWMLGEDRDSESGCHHLAHAAWHCLSLITFSMRGLGTDNRAPAKPSWDDLAESEKAWLLDEIADEDAPIPYGVASKFQMGDIVQLLLDSSAGEKGRVVIVSADGITGVRWPCETISKHFPEHLVLVSRPVPCGAV